MSVVQTLIGNIKGPQGNQGIQGETGAAGSAASVTVGTTTTTAYGNAASVTNSGTSSAAVLDFVIPQGKPGEATTKMGDLLLDSITTSAADFPSPQVGDTGKTAFGKIVKFFTDTLAMFTKHAGDIAVISDSPTSRSFNKGDYLVYNDQLYKVTANIASGGNLTPGTNISSTSAGSELTSLNDSLANVGTQLSHDGTQTSLANGTYTQCSSIELTPGTWIVNGIGTFASNSTGRRAISLSTSETASESAKTLATFTAVNGAATIGQKIIDTKVNSNTTFYLFLYQNSGSSLNATGYLRAVRIK